VCGTPDGRTRITITQFGPVDLALHTGESQNDTTMVPPRDASADDSQLSRVPETPDQSQDIPHGQTHFLAYGGVTFHGRTGVALESPHSSWGSSISYDSQSGLGHPRR
jgi:hypothetical protein